MEITRESAERISKLIQEASALCDESLRVVKSNETLGQVQVYGRLAGQFLGDSFLNILAPVWKAFPELEPSHMREPYKSPTPILTAESQEAIRRFAASANLALSETSRILESSHALQSLPFGGFPEVQRATKAIEDFLAKPRFRDEESAV